MLNLSNLRFVQSLVHHFPDKEATVLQCLKDFQS